MVKTYQKAAALLLALALIFAFPVTASAAAGFTGRRLRRDGQ